MRWDCCLSLLVLAEVSDFNVTLLGVRDGEHSNIGVWVERTESLWVVASIQAVDKCQVGEVVHIDLHLEYDYDLVFSELDSLYFAAK